MTTEIISDIVLKIFLDLAIILFVTKLFGVISKKLGMPQVVGMVIAGLLIGPAIIGLFTNGFGLIRPLKEDVINLSSGQTTSIEFIILKTFAQIGVLMILFSCGLKTNVKKLKKNSGCAVLLAVLGVIIPFVLGFLIATGYVGGFSKIAANKDLFLNCLLIGTIMTATSVGITVETLRELGKLSGNIGTTIVSAAIIDDVLGIVILSIVLSLKNGGSVLTTLLHSGLFFVYAIIFGFLLRKIFAYIMKKTPPHSKIAVIFSLAVCFLYAYCAKKFFGVDPITGAYIAGLMLSGMKDSEYMEKAALSVGNFIFIPIFFAYIGIGADFSSFTLKTFTFGIVFVLVAILGKLVAGFIAGKIFKKNSKESLQLGSGMIARGEVALAVYGAGAVMIVKDGIDPIIGVVLLVVLSNIICPILLKLLNKEKPKIVKEKEERDFYNINGTVTGETYFKGDPIPQGKHVMVVMIAIQNSRGQFLYQKRSKRKGGNWGVTGGHPKHGETPKQGILTEVKEELGIDITKQKIEVVKRGHDDTHCFVMYYVKMDLNTKKLTLQKSELSRVKWFSLEKLEKMKKQGKLSVNQIAFLEKLKIFLEKKNKK